jgi:hypothetical protein
MQTGPYGAWNCGPSVTQELINLASVGRLNIDAWRIRKASGDTSGGIEGSVLAAVTNSLTSGQVRLISTRMTYRPALRDLLKRQSVGFIINCAVTVRTPYRTNYFTGLHWVTAAAGTLRASDNTIRVEDPGTTTAGWKRWPAKLLFDAAAAVRDTTGHTGSYWILVAPPTENVNRKARKSGVIRAAPDLTAKRVGHFKLGDPFHVRRTLKGGPWRRPDGTVAYGWNQVDHAGGVAYVTGLALA